MPREEEEEEEEEELGSSRAAKSDRRGILSASEEVEGEHEARKFVHRRDTSAPGSASSTDET